MREHPVWAAAAKRAESREDRVAVPNTCQRILPRGGSRGRGTRGGWPVGARAAIVLSPVYLAHREVIMSRWLGRAAEDGLCPAEYLCGVRTTDLGGEGMHTPRL